VGEVCRDPRPASTSSCRAGGAALEGSGTRWAGTRWTELLRGGRSGEVRLKLFLSLLWFGRNIPDLRVAHPRSPGPNSSISRTRLPPAAGGYKRPCAGQRKRTWPAWTPPRRGNRHPLARRHRLRRAIRTRRASRQPAQRPPRPSPHLYVQLPSSFWTSGWICVLSGAAVAMYLAVLHAQGPAGDSRQVWFSPGIARSQFDLSDDTGIAHHHLPPPRRPRPVRRQPVPQRLHHLPHHAGTARRSPAAAAPASHRSRLLI